MNHFLFDTNHASEYFKKPGNFLMRVASHSQDEFGLCMPVLSELWYMVYTSTRIDENQRKLQQLVGQTKMWPFGASEAELFGQQKTWLRKAGKTVADVDLQIAIVALSHDIILLSADLAFKNVPGLKLQNWLI